MIIKCCCCARQITHHNTSNEYECPLPATYMGPNVGYCCAECSKDLDSEGMFPEERGLY